MPEPTDLRVSASAEGVLLEGPAAGQIAMRVILELSKVAIEYQRTSDAPEEVRASKLRDSFEMIEGLCRGDIPKPEELRPVSGINEGLDLHHELRDQQPDQPRRAK